MSRAFHTLCQHPNLGHTVSRVTTIRSWEDASGSTLCRLQNQLPDWRLPPNVLVVPVRLTILGSGSGGNCAYVETDETRLLIDAGFSGRQIRQRLASIARTPESLHGILLTHEHSDHV